MFAKIKALARYAVSSLCGMKTEGKIPFLPETVWLRPGSFCDMPEDQLRYIYDNAKCPYCKSDEGLYEGPQGGASINMFCGNPDCNSRFNVTDPNFGFVPLGQFTGECPESFIAQRRKQIAEGQPNG